MKVLSGLKGLLEIVNLEMIAEGVRADSGTSMVFDILHLFPVSYR